MLRLALLFTLSLSSFAELIEVKNLSDGEQAMLKEMPYDHKTYQVWPQDGTRLNDPQNKQVEESQIKGILRIHNVSKPSFTWIKPKKANGRSIILCPGGAYNILAASHEGSIVAKRFVEMGYNVFILKYRVPRRKNFPKHQVALEDSLRTLKLITFHSDKFGIDKNKIGIMGFSAGGHLSALSIANDIPYKPIDEVDKVQSKLAFGILVYPAYLVEKGALDQMVLPKNQVPIFTCIGFKDKNFLPGVQAYVDHLVKENHPIEYHLTAEIGHGVGYINTPWQQSCEIWLNKLKL